MRVEVFSDSTKHGTVSVSDIFTCIIVYPPQFGC